MKCINCPAFWNTEDDGGCFINNYKDNKDGTEREGCRLSEKTIRKRIKVFEKQRDEFYSGYVKSLQESNKVKENSMKNIEKENIEERIENELIDLGLPLQGNSFMYWRELLTYIFENNITTFTMMEIYHEFAERYKKTDSAVERCLRTGTEKMKKRIKEKYAIDTRITNETIIRLFQIKVF